MNILLIEDDAGLVELMTTMLEELGFSVLSAASGAEALAQLKKQTPGLMLLDYSLPDINGKELIEILIEQQTPLPPFVITTGQGDERIAVDMMKLGAMDYVVKDMLFLEKLPDVVKRVAKEIESDAKLKQAEEALIESEVRFRSFMNASNDPTFIKDEHFRYLFANEQTARFFNRTTEDLIGKTDEELALITQISICQSSDKRALESNEQFTIEEQLVDRIFEVTKLPLQLPNNKKGIGGIMKDITERVVAEKTLKESEEKYRDLINLAQEGIWVIDKNNITSFVNPSMTKMLGYPPEEMIGKSLFDFMDEAGVKVANENIKRRKEGLTEQHDFEFICKNGDRIFCTLMTSPILDSTGNYQGALAGVIDISERKREEEILNVELKLFEYSINHSEEELLQKFLDEAEKLTDSKIGFFHYIEDDQESISLQAWSSNTLNNMCKGSAEATRHYPISKAGVWIDCIKERKPVIHNDYSSLAHKKGLPEGHAPIIRELVVPVIRGNQIKAVLGVGNKKLDYNEADVKSIQRLADAAWETVVRKQAEGKTRIAEENLKTTFDLSPSIICTGNVNTGYFVEANKAVTRILGYSVEEFTSKPFVEFVHPEDRQSTIDEMSELLVGKEMSFFENRYLCKDGSYKWMSWNGSKVDKKEMVTAIANDITERKQAEEKTRTVQENLKNTFDLSPSIICKANLNTGSFIEANRAVSRILGYTIKEFVSKPYLEFVHPDDRQRTIDELSEQMKDKGASYVENRYLCSDGSYKWMAWHNTNPDNNGIITAIGSDITENKQAQLKLNQSKQLLDTSQSIAKLGGWELDIATNNLFWTAETYRIHDTSPEEFAGTVDAAVEFYLPESRHIISEAVKTAIEKGKGFDLELAVKTAKGRRINVRATTEVILRDGKPMKLIGIFQDITEKKLAEEKIRVSEETAQISAKYYENVINNMGDPVFVKDQQSKFLLVNDAFCKIVDLPRDKIIGKTLAEHFPPEEQEHFLKIDKQVLLDGKSNITEESLTVRDGKTQTISTRKTRFIDKKGKKYLVGVIRDLTESKQAEEEIRAVEEKYRIMIETSNDIIWMLDQKGHFSFINDHAEKATGHFRNDLIGNSFTPLVLEDELPFLNEVFANVMLGESISYEMSLKTVYGNILTLAVNSAPLSADGKVYAALSFARDISLQKEAERLLKESEKRFKALHNASFGGITIHDMGIIKDCNQGLSDITGYTIDELIGMDGLLCIAEDSRNIARQNILASYEKAYEVVGLRKNGEEYALRLEAKMIPYEGKTMRVVEFRDISEQKKAEDDIRRLSTAVKQSPSIIVITDPDGKLEYINPKFTELTGYTSSEAIGQESNILKSGKQDPSFYKKMWEVVESGKVWRGQFQNKKKNGELFWEAASISAILNESGDVINFIKIGEDVTELKQIENDLINATEKALENEEKYRLLHENAGLGIGYYTTDGTVISFNSIASRDMNGIPEDFAGKSIFDLFPKEYADFYFERLQKSVNSNEIEVYEDCVDLPTQTKWFLSTYTKIVNSKNEVLGIQIISQNITNIKQSETDLKSALAKAMESDRLKSAFLSNMSHEIRTPMNGILGFIDLLNEPDLSKDEINEYSSVINRGGERLLNTINDIIDISRIEAGEVMISKTEISINSMMEELYSFYSPEAEQKGLSLLFKSHHSNEQITVITDSQKLHGVLTNLIKNAIKFTKKGHVSFGYLLKDNSIDFFVKDTGIGIPKDRVQSIFNRFEQADIEDTMAFEGSGLGLAISKAYVEMLGGEITVISDVGKGTAFTFTIPYDKNGGK